MKVLVGEIFLHGPSSDCLVASSRRSSDSFTPYPCRPSSAHTIGTLFLSSLLRVHSSAQEPNLSPF